MTDGDSIAQVAVVVLLLALAVPALGTAYQYAGTPYAHEDTLTVDVGNTSSVAANATQEGYGDAEEIVVGGTTLVEGTDYQWDASDGVVTWLSSANTSEGASARIEYEAYQRTAQSEAAWSIIAPLMGLFGLFGLVACVRAVWQYTAEVWDLT